jgi:hypothetical protein
MLELLIVLLIIRWEKLVLFYLKTCSITFQTSVSAWMRLQAFNCWNASKLILNHKKGKTAFGFGMRLNAIACWNASERVYKTRLNATVCWSASKRIYETRLNAIVAETHLNAFVKRIWTHLWNAPERDCLLKRI